MAVEESLGNLKFTLRNGVTMPAVGLGTFRIRDGEVLYEAVDYALGAGYRLFDTAAVYHNEALLGNALRELLPKHGLDREDIFITTKLAPSDHGSRLTRNAFERSLQNLGLDYIDLYLIHFPGATKISGQSPQNAILRAETWGEFIKLYDEGKVKAIGVSNFTVEHLQQLKTFTNIGPMVNQVEWHPHYYQPDLLRYCDSNNIQLQAYCSFGGLATRNNSLINDNIVTDIASKMNVSPAQVLLAWAIQNGIGVIPKSINQNRLKQNIQMNFRLSENDLWLIDTLGEVNCKYAWDPSLVA